MRSKTVQSARLAVDNWRARFDWDAVLAYETKKVIVIKDRWLGALKVFAAFCVTVYFLYVPMWSERAYLRKDYLSSWVQVSLLEPDVLSPFDLLPYCTDYTDSESNQVSRKQACFRSSSDVLTDGSGPSELFITTHVKQEVHNTTCMRVARSADDVSRCEWTLFEVFSAEPERHKIVIAHGVSRAGSMRTAAELDGYLVCDTCSRRSVAQHKTGSDSLDVMDLLRAAGVSADGMDDGIRYNGMVLTLEIHYEHNWVGQVYKYEYRVTAVAASAVRPVLDTANSEITEGEVLVQLRSGLRVIVTQTGSAGTVTLMSFLTAWVSSMALLRGSRVCVDYILAWVMPLRDVYRMMKWEETVDFSDFRAGEPSAVSAVKQLRELRRKDAARGSSLFGHVFTILPKSALAERASRLAKMVVSRGKSGGLRLARTLKASEGPRKPSSSASSTGYSSAASNAASSIRRDESADSFGASNSVRHKHGPDDSAGVRSQDVAISVSEALGTSQGGTTMVPAISNLPVFSNVARELLQGQEALRTEIADLSARFAVVEAAAKMEEAIVAKADGLVEREPTVEPEDVRVGAVPERPAGSNPEDRVLSRPPRTPTTETGAAYRGRPLRTRSAEAVSSVVSPWIERQLGDYDARIASLEVSRESHSEDEVAGPRIAEDLRMELDERIGELRARMDRRLELLAAAVEGAHGGDRSILQQMRLGSSGGRLSSRAPRHADIPRGTTLATAPPCSPAMRTLSPRVVGEAHPLGSAFSRVTAASPACTQSQALGLPDSHWRPGGQS